MISVNGSHQRPRVLQLSYACSPLRGSEAGVGWRRAVQSAKHFDTWVICEEHEFAGEICQYIEEHGDIPGLHFVYVPMNRRVWALGNIHDAVWYVILRRWHRHAYLTAKRLHEQIRFDLIHQVTFCGYREPGYLWKLDAPFLWGPIGGTQNYPWRFLLAAGISGAAYETFRSITNSLQLRFSPRVRAVARKASLILAANTSVQRDFARAHGIAPHWMLETGLDRVSEDNHNAPETQASDGVRPLRILWSGHLIHRKALHLLIEALARLPQELPYELRIVGDGPMRRRWERLAKRSGVARHVAWLGRLPFQKSLNQYDWADLFVFTSLRDTSGNVVLEAMAAGVPVLCLDHQGMHDIVTEECGVKIPVHTPKQVVADLSQAVARLARNRVELMRLGHGAIERAKTFLWSRQDGKMEAIYRSLIGENEQMSRVADETHAVETENCFSTR